MAEDKSRGLPMAARWNPEKLAREKAELAALESKPLAVRAAGYIKRTGPGLLQSAMTLGAGSATASVVAGASFGYKLLWVQPVAMFLGVMMLAALGNVVLTTGERPYRAFGERLSTKLAFLWALGTILSSIIWHFPQYGLAAGAARDLVTMAGAGAYAAGADGARALTAAGIAASFGVGILILGINIFTVWSYGSSARGQKLYEWFLRSVIALIILMFAVVVIGSIGRIDWAELGKGFIGWYGIPGYQDPKHVTLVLGMLGAAVGINMTFLYPYSLLAKGWGREHKTLARWDLGMSMFMPFTVVTSLVIIAMTVTGVYSGADGLRNTLTPVEAAASLTGILGRDAGRIIFDLGLMAMTCTAISTHMVVCGFTLCEMLGLEYTRTRFRIFALAPTIGMLGVVTELPFWFPVVASAVCFAMLPIAYLTFLIMNNMRSYIGDAVGKGAGRVAFNLVLIIALAAATIGSVIQIKHRVIDKLRPPIAIVTYAAPEGEPRSTDYEVTANGTPVDVYVARTLDEPFKDKQWNHGGAYSFANFDCRGSCDVTIRSARDLTNAVVRPAERAPAITRKDAHTLILRLTGPAKVSVEPDGKNGPLLLFANPLEVDPPAPDAPNVRYFGPGMHKPDVIALTDGQTLYVAGGAVVKGAVEARGSNITIRGRGVLDGSEWPWTKGPRGAMLDLRGENLTVEGVTIRGSWGWTIVPRHSRNVTITGVKICNGRVQNDDGINPCNSRQVAIRDCFIRSDDDCIALKGLDFGGEGTNADVDGISVENCTLWCDRARIFLLGHESRAKFMRNVRAENIDIIRFAMTPFLLEPGEEMRLEDVTFASIRLHGEGQRSLVVVRPVVNQYMRTQVPGHVRGILFEDIAVEGSKPGEYGILVSGADDAHRAAGVTFRRVTVQGRAIDRAAHGVTVGPHTDGVEFHAE